MALNFADVANKKLDEIERPPLPPVGSYAWRVTKLPEQSKVGKDDQYEVVGFTVQAVEAMDDVDMEDYKGDISGIINRVQFMFDTQDEVKFEQTLFRLKTFLERDLGIKEETVTEGLNASVGAQFLGTLKYRQDKNDPDLFYAEIGKTAPLD